MFDVYGFLESEHRDRQEIINQYKDTDIKEMIVKIIKNNQGIEITWVLTTINLIYDMRSPESHRYFIELEEDGIVRVERIVIDERIRGEYTVEKLCYMN